MAVATRMSAAEYLATPESRPQHTELFHGTVVMNEPSMLHMRAQQELHLALMTWVRAAERRGEVGLPTDIRIDETTVVAPDLWWICEERRPARDALLLASLPDLVVEVRSPSTWARDLSVKLPIYEAAGIAEAWYVDTDARTVLVFRRGGATSPRFDYSHELHRDQELTSPLLPGFTLQVDAIFRR